MVSPLNAIAPDIVSPVNVDPPSNEYLTGILSGVGPGPKFLTLIVTVSADECPQPSPGVVSVVGPTSYST